QRSAGDMRQVVLDGAHRAAVLARLRFGKADRGNLRIREYDPRDGRVVGGGGVQTPRAVVDVLGLEASGDGRARGARLVLALVSEKGAPVDVADGIEPVGAVDEHGVVDRQLLAEPDGLEPEALRVRAPAGRDENLVGLQLGSVV